MKQWSSAWEHCRTTGDFVVDQEVLSRFDRSDPTQGPMRSAASQILAEHIELILMLEPEATVDGPSSGGIVVGSGITSDGIEFLGMIAETNVSERVKA